MVGCLFEYSFLKHHSKGLRNPLNDSTCILANDDNSSYFTFRRPADAISAQDFYIDYSGASHITEPGYDSTEDHVMNMLMSDNAVKVFTTLVRNREYLKQCFLNNPHGLGQHHI